MRYRYIPQSLSLIILLFSGTFLFFLSTRDVRSAQEDVSISVSEIVASGFSAPVQVTNAGDGSGRLFVVEQPGRLKIIENGSVLTPAFLDITSLVKYGGEQGLLGLAFHPDYSTNGYFYLNYTRKSDGDTVIARYQVSPNSNLADPSSAQIIMIIDQPHTNHNGGQLLFGPDGYLYIGMGDGGSGGDPSNYAQNINSLLGKMLRIDVDQGSPYSIPQDNPFVGVNGADEIWALGLRNPWRWSFDRIENHLYIGDVGQNEWEEIDFIKYGTPGGVNFGWRCREGTHIYSTNPPCNNPTFLATLTNPITEYSHSEGYSVSGGFVYRGIRYPQLIGTYFFADYVTGKIYSIKKLSDNPLLWTPRKLEIQAGFTISGFGEDENGELYVINYNGGKIHRLADTSGPIDLYSALGNSEKSTSTPWADPGEIVTFTLSIVNSSNAIIPGVVLSDTIPTGLTYIPGSLTSSSGSMDDSNNPILSWSGIVTGGLTVTVNYQAEIDPGTSGSINNRANIKVSNTSIVDVEASIFSPRPVLATTAEDFLLPGTQPGDLHIPLLDSLDCDTCHSASIYDRWRGSMMSQAGKDPLMWAALRTSNNFIPASGELCLRCHTPTGWFGERSQASDGSQLTNQDIHNGVSCQTCHRLVDPLYTPDSLDETEYIDENIRQNLTSHPPATFPGSGMMVVDPQDNRRGPFSLASTFSYHTAYQADFHGQSGDPVTESRLCGTCHNVDNPLLTRVGTTDVYELNPTGTPATINTEGDLFPIERTFSEWRLSEYASIGVLAPEFSGADPTKLVKTCQDCHMPRSTGEAADLSFNPIIRDCDLTGCLPLHEFSGANTWVPELLQSNQWRLNSFPESSYLDNNLSITSQFLRKSAKLEISLIENMGQKQATITVTNQTGHKLPTGYPEGRRMWLHIRAYDDTGTLLEEFGEYDNQTAILSEDTKIYEVKQGISDSLAQQLGLNSGHSFHFLLNNTVIKDNRIPPRGFSPNTFNQPGLKPVDYSYAEGQHWDITNFTVPSQTTRVTVALYYQTASNEYIEFLNQNGGLDGESLYQLWEDSKSPPQLVQMAWYPNKLNYLPILYK